MPRKFDFISPGILLNEVDKSVIAVETQDEGPLLIGRALTGPAMKPVRVSNLEDFYAIFGEPVSGKGAMNSDVWRDGNLVAPTYAMYAAQAHLASNSTPITFMRLVGENDDDVSADLAGWTLPPAIDTATAAGNTTAYGLFAAPSGSNNSSITGSLMAVFYTTGSALMLSGSQAEGGDSQQAATLYEFATGEDYKLVLSSSDGTKDFTFNFDNTSQSYIRNRFNTNPQKLNASENFSATDVKYFLGESFDVKHQDLIGNKARFATVVALGDGTNNYVKHSNEAQQGVAGWFINKTVDSTNERLFQLVAHSAGEYMSTNFSIEISDLRLGNSINPNSSFTVSVVKNGTAIEKYTGCTLNPSDENYISKKIGDQYQTWDDDARKWNVKGLYPNKSDYFYVNIDPAVENMTLDDAMPIPVGFEGPAVHQAVSVASGSAIISGNEPTKYFYAGANIFGGSQNTDAIEGMISGQSIQFDYPTVKMTVENSYNQGNYDRTSVFGFRHIKNTSLLRDGSVADVTRGGRTASFSNSAFKFLLEDLKKDTASGLWYWEEGSAQNTDLSNLFTSEKIRKFAAPVIGGFDGVDILKVDPFSSNHVGVSGLASYERYTLDKALDIASDPEVTEFDLLAIPGQTNSGITNKMISICETRGDALAIVDLEEIYKAKWEGNNEPTVATAVSKAQERSINSSYAATYYPSVRMLDTAGGNGDVIIVPPSIAGIGAIAKSQGLSEPWFAPAGFNRGGINELGGTQGPRVIGTYEHLSKADRDALYEENINPIARFPASGDIVIFGQKTLQQTPSALDRINVRRLLLYIKRRIGKVSETILFDNNVQATWNRFKSQADAILSDVQSRLGIVEYKLVLDETTTTADLVDRNILYAKVLIKPARAIEFIVVDFVVTRSGIDL